MPMPFFHPVIDDWFNQTFDSPTAVQIQSWQSIHAGNHTLLAAPTGSGKTLAAFLAAIDELVKEGLAKGLPDQTRVLYISPLKALSNDIQINLQSPIMGIRDGLIAKGFGDVEINAWVRTGDTPQSERAKAIKKPPHILVTTPESVYILLTSDSGRQLLSTVRTVIVDEIHAIAGSKRGSHLSLSLQRLQALVGSNSAHIQLQRIGLSATQKPIKTMADFLMGTSQSSCHIVDTGHTRKRDLAIDIPKSPLTALMSNEVWNEVYDQLADYSQQHSTMLVFVNTRRLAERAARFIAERIGEENVMAHHGSMAKEKRLEAEQKLKAGDLKCLVATASLELGIDIGDVGLVCQLGSPRSIAAFLQRVGRSGHAVDGTPKGRIFPLTRDDLVEAAALLKAAEDGELDHIIIPQQPLDVLAQQIVAEVSAQEWQVNQLFSVFNQAWPYRHLSIEVFETVINMLAEGFSTRRGRRGAYIHYDAVNRRVRPRKNARIVALTNGGAIPDQFDCEVILLPESLRIGTVGEDFAFESIPGDVFQLGNNSYRTLKTETGKVYVEDAKGMPPNIPFWFGEAPGRSDELSIAVSQLRSQLDHALESNVKGESWLVQHYPVNAAAAEQLNLYLASSKMALGVLPSQQNIVFERFFDEVGDMHLVIHSCYGSRINKAWGLALRKRFCRQFNFELQASALEDSIVLSLSTTHSFPLSEVSHYLNAKTVQSVLVQAILDVPMFPMRWRWNATIALAVLRNQFGKRTPPYFQRSDAEDLIAVLFPDQIACGENLAGDRIVPEHPLVQQAIQDCLYETMDIDGLIALITGIETGTISVKCCDLTSPSPLAQEIINARPYAFLDDGEAEERRTMAIKSQNFTQIEDAKSLRQLDQAAIDKVKQEAWPDIGSADELHDALMVLGFISELEAKQGTDKQIGTDWQLYFEQLAEQNRSTKISIGPSLILWVCAERLHLFMQLFPELRMYPLIEPISKPQTIEQSLIEIIGSRMEGLGPVTVDQLAGSMGLTGELIKQALVQLEQQGFVIQGQFTRSKISNVEWCERRLLARIHRYTVHRLRNEIEPVALSDFMLFLFQWHGMLEKKQGSEALFTVLQQLEGFSIPAHLWQTEILPRRIKMFSTSMLESLTLSGRISWLRLHLSASVEKQKASPVRLTPITLIERGHLSLWKSIAQQNNDRATFLSGNAEKIVDLLKQKGALFFIDIVQQSHLLKTQVEDILGELVNNGLLSSDSYSGLQALITPAAKRPRINPRRGRKHVASGFDNAGRWSLLDHQSDGVADDEKLEFIAWVLLKRYGVVCRKILEKEIKLPPWRDLLKVYWRLEARGEIRGGRFVQGISGEQFALPEALGSLKNIKNQKQEEELLVISSADPLNLIGTLLSGDKVPVSSQSHLVFLHGKAVAVRIKSEITFLVELDDHMQQRIRAELRK